MTKNLKLAVYKLYSQLLFQRLVIYVINTFSLFMLGGINSVYLASSNLANQVFIIVSLAVAGIAEGSGVIIAQFIGKKDHYSINQIVSYGIVTAGIFGFAVSAGVYFNSGFLMSILTNDAEMILIGQKYMQIASISYFFYAMSTVCFAILRSLKIINIAIVSSITACVVNIVLSLLLVKKLGVQGVAISTTSSRIVELLIVATYILIKRRDLNLTTVRLFKLDRKYAKLYYKTLYPLMMNELLWSFGDSLIVIVFGRLGQDFVTAQSMYSMLSQFTGILLSINVVASIFIGNAIGEGNDMQLHALIRFFKQLSLGVGIIGSITMISGSFIIPAVYDFNSTTNDYIRQILLVTACIEVFKSLQLNYMMGIFRGAGDVIFILANDMIFLWFYAVPVCYITAMVLHLPPWLVIGITRGDQIIKFVTSSVRFRSGKWRKNITMIQVTK